MNLLENSLHKGNFGLRRRFPWVSTNLNSSHIQTHVRRKERRYLTDLLEDVLDDYDYLAIERIENPYLWGQYVLTKEEMRACTESQNVQEHIMIHATSSNSAYKIAGKNIGML